MALSAPSANANGVMHAAVADMLNRVRQPFNVNTIAQVAALAALDDAAYVDDSARLNREGIGQLYRGLDRLAVRHARSHANFVLVRVGDRASELVRAAPKHGVYLRDRSAEPGCDGCIRMATGIVEHTKRGLEVLEGVLCGVR